MSKKSIYIIALIILLLGFYFIYPAKYYLNKNGDEIVGLSFNNPIQIKGNNGEQIFFDCYFKNKLIFSGKEKSQLSLTSCDFLKHSSCIIDNSLHLDKNKRKPFIWIYGSNPKIKCENGSCKILNIMNVDNIGITFNGRKYNFSNLKYYKNKNGILTLYTNQPINSIWLHQFWKNNHRKILVYGSKEIEPF